MKRVKNVKKTLSLSRETIRPLEQAELRDAHGAVIASRSICNPCPPPTGLSYCKSCFNSDCCLATQQDPDLCVIR